MMAMRWLSHVGLLLVAFGATSCRITNGRVDSSWIADRVTAEQNDDVHVEAGRGLASRGASPVAGLHGGAQPAGLYTIRPGDTLGGIAHRHSVSVASLKAANSLSGDVIVAGRTLRIPGALPSQPAPSSLPSSPSGGRYTVRPGDTYSSIARRSRVSLEALLRENGQTRSSCAVIKPGQVIRLPKMR